MKRIAIAGLLIGAAIYSISSAQADGQFLQIIAAHDEPRRYCVDVIGHRDRVQLDAPLQAHTCKPGRFNQDELFDPARMAQGQLYMPAYQRCLQATGQSLLIQPCTDKPGQKWSLSPAGQLSPVANSARCVTLAAGAGRDAGGRAFLARGLSLSDCSPAAVDRQRWQFKAP